MIDQIRLAIVSTALPPGISGQAMVLGRLAGGHDELDLTLISDNDTTFPLVVAHGDGSIGRYFKLQRSEGPLIPVKLPRGLAGLNFSLGLRAAVFRRGREIENIARSQQAHVVLACSGNPFDLAGAALAARRTGLPLIAYLFDDPIYQWPTREYRDLARRLEPQWSAVARAVVCPNPRLAAEYSQRGLQRPKPKVIYNPLLDDQLLDQAPIGATSTQAPSRIVYTGSVYEAQADALINVAAAAAESLSEFQLHIYSPQTAAEIKAHGLSQPSVISHSAVSDMQAAEIQRNADILVLPLCFHSNIQQTILSASPGKMGEYLCAGRPILVHAPADSYVAEFFRQTGSGLVVSDDNPAAVLTALRRIRADFGLREQLQKAAQVCKQKYSKSAARSQFLHLIADTAASR